MFTVLFRAHTTGTKTYYVRLSEGLYNATDAEGTWRTHYATTALVDNQDATHYKFYPLGVIEIPRGRHVVFSGIGAGQPLENYALRLESKIAVAGTGNLEGDCLVLIPMNEGFCHIKNGELDWDTNVRLTYIMMDAVGNLESVIFDNVSGASVEFPELDAYNLSLPTGQGSVITAAQRTHATYGHQTVITDQMGFQIKYAARWKTLRGSDAP